MPQCVHFDREYLSDVIMHRSDVGAENCAYFVDSSSASGCNFISILGLNDSIQSMPSIGIVLFLPK